MFTAKQLSLLGAEIVFSRKDSCARFATVNRSETCFHPSAKNQGIDPLWDLANGNFCDDF